VLKSEIGHARQIPSNQRRVLIKGYVDSKATEDDEEDIKSEILA